MKDLQPFHHPAAHKHLSQQDLSSLLGEDKFIPLKRTITQNTSELLPLTMDESATS